MIFECIANAWSPKFGDPHLLGWVTAVCYIFAAIPTFLVFRRSGGLYSKVGKARVFWLGLTLLLVFLGLNKQLDLQAFLKDAAKCHAMLEGWYGDRREFQLIFLVGVAVTFFFLLVFILSFFRENLTKDWLAVAGVVFLLVFILIHASYFNYFDIGAINKFYENGWNWVLELIGIFLICLQSFRRLRG